jgi:hypothetical protein
VGQFSLNSYKALLRDFMDWGWSISPLSNAWQTTPQSRAIFLRHDVDYSVELAVKMAEANAELSISGTFCLQLRADLYNLANEHSQKAVTRLLELNQTVALHFMLPDNIVAKGVPTVDQVRALVERDAAHLNNILDGRCTPVLSWHNPSVLGPSFNDLISSDFSPLLNANWLIAQGMRYLSDANHRHTPQSWRNLVAIEPGPIQALFHPLQWVIGGDTMEETLAGTWTHIFRQSERTYLSNHVYRSHFPQGLPQIILDEIQRAIASVSPCDE